MNYCSACGQAVTLCIPAGDDRPRHVCNHCQRVHYDNPKMIVCTLPCYQDQVLLCKRAIEPRYGLWTVPGGFMENSETLQQGALRETIEEAGARVRLTQLYAIYNLPHISQTHFFFLAQMTDLDFCAGEESQAVKLFKQDQVPWEQLAFTAVKDVLMHYFQDLAKGQFPQRLCNLTLTGGRDYRIETFE